MKVAILGVRGYPYVYSGYETLVSELADRLTPRGIEVTVYCHKGLFKEHPKEVNGVKLVYFKTIQGKVLAQPLHSAQAMWHAVRQDFDIIFVANSSNGPFGLLSKLFGKKTIMSMDGMEWLRPKWKGFGAKYFYWTSWIATKLFDEIITDAIGMRDFYRNTFKRESTMITYGANLRHSTKPELLDKWNLKKDDYYLIVGRLIPDNNSDVIVREFIKSNSTKRLCIVGDVPYKDDFALNIKKYQEQDDRVFFTGYIYNQDVLAELYHNCFMYFHGHEFGGTNPTLLKALAYGSGIMALDTVFAQEVLLEGKHGRFFTKEEGNLKALIEEMEKSPEVIAEFQRISRDRIKENYTWKKVTDQYIELFEKTAKKKKS